MWLIAIYEEEKGMWGILEEKEGVQCFENYFIINILQKLEPNHESICYYQVYNTDIVLQQSASGTGQKFP